MRLSIALAASFTAFVSAQTPPNLTALLTSQPQLSSLVQLLNLLPNVTSALAARPNSTLFAPSNSALAAILSGGTSAFQDPRLIEAVLRYHVVKGVVRSSAITQNAAFVPTLLDYSTPVQGGGVIGSNVTGGQVIQAQVVGRDVVLTTGLKSTAKVVTADLAYNNGVVHIIDTLLTPPAKISETVIAGNFSALAGAAIRTNLIGTLDNTRDLTVFVPNNDAFQAIASTAANLTIQQLSSVLSYHVIAGTVAYSSTLKNGSVPTLNGGNLTVRIDNNGAVFVNQARVINADVLVANGVIHVIDSVLIPGVNSTSPTGPRPTGPIPFTSGVPRPTSVQSGLAQSTSAVAGGSPRSSATTSAPAQATTNAAVGGLKVGMMEMAVLVGGVVGLGL